MQFSHYAIDILNTDENGAVVLKGSVWRRGRTKVLLTVYAYTGIKAKRHVQVARMETEADEQPAWLTMLENMAHLWAMQAGISEFAYSRRNADHRHLYHPSQRKQLKENQSCPSTN